MRPQQQYIFADKAHSIEDRMKRVNIKGDNINFYLLKCNSKRPRNGK